MRSRAFRGVVWGPVVVAAIAMVLIAAPVDAVPPENANPAWGDITSVVAGPGLTGGSADGDATLSVDFAGTGSATTAARSDHDHDGRYSLLAHDHDGRYSLLAHDHDGRYAPWDISFDDRYLPFAGGTLTGTLTAPLFVSSAPQGTAPLQVGSDTLVQNLNADLLDGRDASEFALRSDPSGDVASLSGANAFAGMNTFNNATTFANSVGFTTGGASFMLQTIYGSPTSYSLRLIDSRAGPTRLVLDQNGRIGIGTTSPTSLLHVVGDIRALGLNLGSGVLSPLSYDMSSASDRTFSFTNSGTGVGNLSVEGMVSAAAFSVSTTGPAARAGTATIASGDTTRTVATSAVGSASLVFVTADASRPGCVPAPGPLYVSARDAGTGFTVAVAGAAPGAPSAYCFDWWVVN